MPYASTSLANFERIDPDGGLVADNLRCVQKMIDTEDEQWFHVIHVEVEAHAGPAIAHCRKASIAAATGDHDVVLGQLEKVPEALDRMVATFRRITEKCRPEYYFKTLRPYLFGFTDVVYEGVEKFAGAPQTFAGETGAQSTAIPALRALLGLEHNEGGLTTYLTDMIDHMPVPHRQFLASIDSNAIRSFVVSQNAAKLNSAYNACLQSTLEFRSLHLNMARSYIASRMGKPNRHRRNRFHALAHLVARRDRGADALMAEHTPRIAVHGGAWDWPDDLDEGKLTGLLLALEEAMGPLQGGGSALDAVETAVRVLEDNPVFDAGTGGYLNQDGVVQLDSLIADGEKGDFGAIAGVTNVSHPISLARRVLHDMDECFFVGTGAERLAEQLGLADVNGNELETPAMRAYFDENQKVSPTERDGPRDTVGAVAIDAQGRLAAATSTSGTPFKPVGRVGDSAIFGAGAYARRGAAAVGTTGQGEQIYRTLLAKYVSDCIELGMTASQAAHQGAIYFEEQFASSMSGIIMIDHKGQFAASQTAPKMAHAWIDDAGQLQASVLSTS